MAQRERLGHLKFMQRAKVRDEQKKKEVADDAAASANEWTVPANLKPSGTKCVVIVEGDPVPSAGSGRMSFQSSTSSAETTNIPASQLSVVGASESGGKPTVQR